MIVKNRAKNKDLEKLIIKVMDYFNVTNVDSLLISKAESPCCVQREIDIREPAKVYKSGLTMKIRINPFYLLYHRDSLEFAERLFYSIVHECKHCIDLADENLINEWSGVKKRKYHFSRRSPWAERPEEKRAIEFTEFHKGLNLSEKFYNDILNIAIGLENNSKGLII